MKVLVVGSGGREHALAWKLSQEAEVIAAPGNPGIASVAECVDVSVKDFEGLRLLCNERQVDLVVVGPEDPLVNGLADYLRADGIAVFGPGRDGAELEGSKAFSKHLMREAEVPTARFASFHNSISAKEFAARLWAEGSQAVVKASGNALGKGVIVCTTLEEANDAIDAMLVDREFGEAGGTIVVEERLTGREFSLLTLCSGSEILSLPVAQDYKRALDGDRGPNTGGMGSYSPVAHITAGLVRDVERAVVKPILDELRRKDIDYRGMLFSGLMQTVDGTKCLEYNVRFGDPETQSIVCRLGSGLCAALLACAKGEPIPPIEVLDNAVVSVVLASGGYPGDYTKGHPITMPQLPENVHVFHAGTALKDGQLVTNGGRVLACTAVARTVSEARNLAYQAAEAIQFEGKQFRKDIAQIS